MESWGQRSISSVRGRQATAEIVLVVLAGIALAILTPHAWASELLAPPQWSSDQVRAARPTGASEGLSFDIQITSTAPPSATKVTSSSVNLTQTYTYVIFGAESRLVDRTLCRDLSWGGSTGVFDSLSCFANPAFRQIEIVNRRYQRLLLAKLGPKAAKLDDAAYWGEAELGVQEAPSKPLTKTSAAGAVEYRLGKDVVVRITGEAAKMTPDESREFGRYLALYSHLHPQVRRDLIAGSTLPARIEIATRLLGKTGSDILVISNARRDSAAYPLPRGLVSGLRRDANADGPLKDRAIAASVKAIIGASSIPKPGLQELITGMDRAAANKDGLSGLLLFFNLTQQYGDTVMKDPNALQRVRADFDIFQADPRCLAFLNASNLAGDSKSPGDRRQAAASLAGLKTDSLPFGTFKYVTFANLVRSAGDVSKWDPASFKGMPSSLADDYWTHIAAYPWASNVYKDLGDTYYLDYDPVNAWLAYDLGRAVDPNWRGGVMRNLSDYEDKLRTDEPDFF